MRISDWSSDVCSSDLAWVVPIQRFDGAEWSAPDNLRVDGELFSVSAVSPDDLWAVGSRVGEDRKSVVYGKSVSVRVDLGGRRTINKKKPNTKHINHTMTHIIQTKLDKPKTTKN